MRLVSLLYVLPLVAATVANAPRDPRRHHALVARAAHVERAGVLDDLFNPKETSSTTASSAPPIGTTKPTTSPTLGVLPSTPVTPTPSETSSVSSSGGPDSSNPPSPSVKPSSSSPHSSAGSSSSSSPSTTSSSSAAPSSSAARSSSSSSASPSASTSAGPSPSVTSSESSSEEQPTSTKEEEKPETSAFVSTNANGGLITIYRTIEQTASAAASSAGKKDDDGLSKGAIIGIAVGSAAGGIALIAGLIFLLTRRRNEPGGEAILWPELNHHGDADTHHALPVSGSGSRMSLGDELDGPAVYYGEKSDDGYAYSHDAHDVSPALNGTAFGGSASFADYDQQYPQQPHQDSYYDPADHDYSNMPPPVQPRTSPVQPAYEWDPTAPQDGYDGYAGVHRQESPPMTGVGANAMPVSFNPASHHGQY